MPYEHLPRRNNGRGTNSSNSDSGNTVVTLEELENKYSLVDADVSTGTITVTDPSEGIQLAQRKDLEAGQAVSQGEITGSGESLWRRSRLTDYNPQLSGHRALDTYREMKNDAIVRSSLRVAKTPILSARWFMEPASQDPEDVYRAQFIWDNLNKWMSISWPQFITEALYMMDYGTYVFEKVFDVRIVPNAQGQMEPKVIWKKFAPRLPYEIEEFVYDDEGGPSEIVISTDEGPVPLPIAKGLVFTFDKEGGDLWGVSILRSAYKHWFFKEQLYKIDAIQKERHGIGIPVIKLPPNFSDKDKLAAQRIGLNLRTNEEAHVVLPPGWEVMFLKLEGQRVDALESAQHHAEKLYENVLANFMINNNVANDADVQEHVFTRAVRFTAEILRDVLNKYAIPQLIDFNWGEEELENGYPQLKVRRLGDERDWRVISFAIRNLVGAGVVRPDDQTEAWIREELDMPVADPDTARQIVEEVGMGQDPDDPVTDDDPENRAGFDRNPNRNAGNRQSGSGNMKSATSPGSTRGDSSGTSETS